MDTTLVLIHGAWHGSWCWSKLIPYLNCKNIICLDLPGRSCDYENLKRIGLKTQVDYVVEQINQIPGKAIILGHSMAGLIISLVAERIPEKINKLIYLAAFVPQNGESLFSITSAAPEPGISAELEIDMPSNTIGVKQSARTQAVFYNLTSDSLAQYAMQKLVPEALLAFNQKCNITNKSSDIEKIYIKCLEDNAITPAFQDKMITKLNNPIIFSLKADHSPFLSTPEALAELLNAIMVPYPIAITPSLA